MKEQLVWVYGRANQLLEEFGLKQQGWVFQVNNNQRRIGVCKFNRKLIQFSMHYLLKTPKVEIEETIRHEIAHALVGPGHGHDYVWKAKAIECGAKPLACDDGSSISTAKPNYLIKCENCGWSVTRFRMRQRNYGSTCPRCRTEVTIYSYRR